jgi:hypothetical protein
MGAPAAKQEATNHEMQKAVVEAVSWAVEEVQNARGQPPVGEEGRQAAPHHEARGVAHLHLAGCSAVLSWTPSARPHHQLKKKERQQRADRHEAMQIVQRQVER